MNQKIVTMIAWGAFALAVMFGECWQAQAQDPKAPYASMAPLDQYLMADRNAEIALGRSAAPDAISRDADVLVLGKHGYETAVKGKNGLVCVVERSWMLPYDDPEFWNSKVRLPLCLNPSAARSHLPLTFNQTVGFFRDVENPDVRQDQDCVRQERTAGPRAWIDVETAELRT